MAERLKIYTGALLLLPAACWFILVALRWFGITERFEVLSSTLEGSGPAFLRGLVLFVLCPACGAAFGLWAVLGRQRRVAGAVVLLCGLMLTVANIVTRQTGP